MQNKKIKISISVMAHESRSEHFEYLKKQLGDVPFSIDKIKGTGHIGLWNNCKRAWLKYDPKADYHVVIQDDAIVCDRFKERAEKFIEKYHTGKRPRAFSFFYGNKMAYADQAHEGLKDGVVFRHSPNWGVAICMPTNLIKDMINFCDTLHNPEDDVRIGKFTKKKDILVVFPMPSLIDHRTGNTSLVGCTNDNRKAIHFIENYERN